MKPMQVISLAFANRRVMVVRFFVPFESRRARPATNPHMVDLRVGAVVTGGFGAGLCHAGVSLTSHAFR